MGWFKRKKKNTTVAPQMQPSENLSYIVANLQGIGNRIRQEDAFTLMNALDERKYNEYGLMFAVCDGMGGMKDGRLASETAVNNLRNSFGSMDINGNIARQLEENIYTASYAVESLLDGDGGSTAVTGIIIHEQLYFASVGDSFLYLKRDGKLFRLNTEHNLCHKRYLENIRDGYLEPFECRNDAEAVALEQFLGMSGMSEVDCSFRPMYLQSGDVLLACSDGVGGVLSESEILSALENISPHEACRQLESMILNHNKANQDNYTALIIQCI